MEPHESPSIIQSPREAEIAEIQAKAEAAALEQKKSQQKLRQQKILKISLFVFAGLIGLALIIAVIWFIIVAINAAKQPVNDPITTTPSVVGEYAVIEGYQCTTDSCNKVVDLPDSRFLVQDGNVYYIYNPGDASTVRTTIPEQRYQAITPFVWGDEILAELDPDTGRSALYSITRNSQLTGFSYSSFYMNSADAVYQGMEWVVGSYIVAQQDNSLRLLDVFDGAEIVQATNRVFAYNPYFFGYDNNSERRAYTDSGAQIVIAYAGDKLFIRDNYLIYVPSGYKTTFRLFDASGTELKSDNAYYQNLRETLSGQSDYASAIAGLSGVYVVPE